MPLSSLRDWRLLPLPNVLAVWEREIAMARALRIRVAKRGRVTLPEALRDRYGIREGDDLSLLDLGGIFVLNPAPSRVDELADRISEVLQQEGESLESMLHALHEDRSRALQGQNSSTKGLTQGA